MICKHCQKEMPLQSFRPPPNRCVHCDHLQDPYLPRSHFGCFFLTPIAIVSALASGYIALRIGRLLAPVLQIPGFDVFLAILVGFDAVAVVCIVHVKRFRGPTEQSHAGPLALGFMYFAIGLRSARGMGLEFAIWTGVVNTVVASVVTIGILRLVNYWPETQQITKR